MKADISSLSPTPRAAAGVATALSSTDDGRHADEVASRRRFPFGENWRRFLLELDEGRIARAEASLREMLEIDGLAGVRFLDVGCGSGLFSLAAWRMGAQVHSFDFDPQSVACAAELKRRFSAGDSRWTVEEGSILDAAYVGRLGAFDVVYAWGVLHHTGDLWRALQHTSRLVAPGGRLFIAIYNDMGAQSSRWRAVKRTYNALPRLLQLPFAIAVSAPAELRELLAALARRRLGTYLAVRSAAGRTRGMSYVRDRVDWVGGYPYEVATPDALFHFHRARGFLLTKLHCGGVGLGCNELVFRRAADGAAGLVP